MDDGVDAAHRVPDREGIAEISKGDLDVDPMLPEPLGIPDEDPHPVSLAEQLRQELSADDAGCSRKQDHVATVATGRRHAPRLGLA
jgi:hypothetical protein